MAAERCPELGIKIAKAKDLAPSWFDLVLRPEKFQQHLKTLEMNPNGSVQYALVLCSTVRVY